MFARNLLVVSFALGGVVWSSQTQAIDVPKFWNTGEALTSGQTDNHWMATKIVGSSLWVGTNATKVMNEDVFPVIGAYRHTGYTNSKWISFTQDGYCNSNDIFRFSQSVYLDPILFGHGDEENGGGSNPTTYRINLSGKFSSDNASEMYVNGNFVSGLPYYEPTNGYSWQTSKTFDISEHFREGWNDISFIVGSGDNMGGNTGPITEWMALRAEGNFSVTAVPEPASILLLGSGFAIFLRRRLGR